VLETVGGVTTRFLVDDHNPTGYAQVAEEIVSGAVVAQYTYGLMRISQGRAGGTSYYGYDAGGSTRQLLSGAGAVTDTYTYDAFGNTVAQTGSTPNEFLYRGEQFDAALVMYYLRARYYLPRTGRFLTADKYEEPAFAHCSCLGPGKTVEPLAVLSLFAFPTSRVDRDRKLVDYKKAHEYLYSAADPVNLIDPSGQGFIENAELNGFEADDVLAEFATQQAERGFPAHVVRFMCLAIAALWAAQSPEATVFEIEQYMEYCLARAGL